MEYFSFINQANLTAKNFFLDQRMSAECKECERCQGKKERCPKCLAIRVGGGYIILDGSELPGRRRGLRDGSMLGPEDVSLLERCPHFRGWYVQASMELGPEDVSLLERCPHFRGWYVQASMELGPEDVSLLERCPHFRGWYVQASMELGPEDVSLLERCPHFRG